MSSNVYHKQQNQHRTRRDRVVVIDSAATKSSQTNNPDTKADQTIQRNVKIFAAVVVLMLLFLFVSIKVLEFLWQRNDESIVRWPSSAPEQTTPAVLSTDLPSPALEVPVVTSELQDMPTASEASASPGDAVEKIFRWGKVLEDAGEMDGALARYREALDADPNNTMVLSQIGRLSIRLGRYSEAVRALQQAIAVSADNPDIMNDLGVALTFDGQPQAAVELYDRLLQQFPDYQAALFNKGYALVQLREYATARPLLEQYLRVKPDDAMAYGVLAVLELAEKQHEKALELLDRAIEVSPTWGTPYLDASAICAGIDQPSRALSYLERGLAYASPADVYRQFQSEAFGAIRLSEEGKAFEKKIAARARELMQQQP